MAREWLMIVKESAFGVPKSTPVLGTDAIYIRLDGGNAFSMVGDPIWSDIMYGGGEATAAIGVSDHYDVVGDLSTVLYGSQAKFLSDWYGQKINTGQTTPWVTTEPPGDLASCSVYHAIQRSDGSIKRLRFAGVKVVSYDIACSRQSQYATLRMSLRAQKWHGNSIDDPATSDPNSTEFPLPAEADYPRDPFRFSDLKGKLTIGTGRTAFASVGLKVENKLDAQWYEDHFLYLLRRHGRASTLDVSALYKPSPDDIASYQNLVAQATSVEFNNGNHFLKFDLNAQNLFRKVGKKLDLETTYELPLSLQNYWDPTAGTDLTITAGEVEEEV